MPATRPAWDAKDLSAPANHAAAVTPSDSVDLTVIASALYIGGAGNVSLVTAGGETVTFVGLLAGSVLPVRVARVRATLTTATQLVALWQTRESRVDGQP